ncbi:MAG: PIN domain-containing protein [Candidatus Aminicenantes bacterium]|nr:MAG: PIN domain-containing protein [Candidatus Aminicenantes bacterium]
MNKYLVDTSIWVDFFRGKSEAIKNRVLDLAANNRIYYNGIVISELLTGAKNQKQFDFIIDNFSGLNYLEMDKDFFIYSSKIIYQLKRSGITLPMSDVMIAAHAKQHNLIVFSKDKHFELTGRKVGFQYDVIKNF